MAEVNQKEVEVAEVTQTDVDIAEANPVKGGDNAEEKKSRPSHFGGDTKNVSKLEKFTKSVNVRLVNYTHSSVMALFIAIVTFISFVLLCYAMFDACPTESTSIEKTVYNTGVLDMQMDFMNKIVNPDNLEEMKKQKAFVRTVDVCIIRAAINVAVQQDVIQLDGNTVTALVNHKQVCWLPDDATFKLMSTAAYGESFNPLYANLKWCQLDAPICNQNGAGGNCEKANNPQGANPLRCDTDVTDKTIGRDFTVHLTYKINESKQVCPTATSVFGAGLAYIAYLEMFATLLVGFVLIKLGVAKPLNGRATIMGLLKSANSDTSKVEDAIDTLRTDVDTIMKDKDELDDDQTKRIESLEEKLASLVEAK